MFIQSVFNSQTQDTVLGAEAETTAVSALERSCVCQKGTCAVLLTEFGGLGTWAQRKSMNELSEDIRIRREEHSRLRLFEEKRPLGKFRNLSMCLSGA